MGEHPITRQGTGYRENLQPPIYQPLVQEVYISRKKLAGIGLVAMAACALIWSQLLPQSIPPAKVVIKDGMAPAAIEDAANNLGLGSRVSVALDCKIELKNTPLADAGAEPRLAMRNQPVIGEEGVVRLPQGQSVEVVNPLKVIPAHSGDTWIGYKRQNFGNPIDALFSLIKSSTAFAWTYLGGNTLGYIRAQESCYGNATQVTIDGKSPAGSWLSHSNLIGAYFRGVSR